MALAVSGFRSFKANFLLACGFTVATIVCAFSHAPWLLAVGAVIAMVVLLGAYWRAVAAAFRPTLNAFSAKVLDSLWGFLKQAFNTDAVVDVALADMNEQQRNTWTANLQLIVLYNRACVFLAGKLRGLRASNLNAAVYIVRLLGLFMVTAWTFFLLNFALVKAMPGEYQRAGSTSGFDVFYYSFNTLFSNSVGGLVPIGVVSRSLAMAATVFMGLLFAVVVVFVVTSLQKSRDDTHMEATIEAIRKHASGIEPYLDERYGMNLQEAVIELHKLRAGLIEWVYYMTPSMRPSEDGDQGIS